MYKKGQGVAEDQQKAASWYLQAAKQGDPQAALEMTFRYALGKGVPENYERAYTFLLLFQALNSGEKADEQVRSLREDMDKLVNADQIRNAQREATAMWDAIQAAAGQ